jgi:hypothetical protein
VAAAVLATGDQIAALASQIGVDPPTDLRSAYETATDSMTSAQALADSELRSAHALVAADAAAARPRDTLVSIGLIGESPDATLTAARSAFQAGAGDAAGRADSVTALLDGAAAVGQSRLTTGIGALVVITILVVAALFVIPRRRDWIGDGVRQAHPAVAATADAPASYATLPDQPTAPGSVSVRPPVDPPEEKDAP